MSKPPLGLCHETLLELKSYRPKQTTKIKLDANESPFDLGAGIKSQILGSLSNVDFHRYPDPQALELRERLADTFGGSFEEYVVGCGSDEIIALLMLTLGRTRSGLSQAAVMYPTPTFVMYRHSAQAHGLLPIEVPLLDDWSVEPDGFVSAIRRHRPNLIFLASPNNPTGRKFSEAELDAILSATDEDMLVVIDEAYGAFAERKHIYRESARIGWMGTLSKVGLAAIRVGWIRLNRNLANEVDKARQPFNLNSLSQKVASLALGICRDELMSQITSVVEERGRMTHELSSLGFSVFPSEANFLLVRCGIGTGVDLDARTIEASLRKEFGIGVRVFNESRLQKDLRITVGTSTENDQLLSALQSIL
ncbi:MAG: aminotransferase class I/II-fold pyridoxal phosphate-dependent enzyme [Myxococcota bacterium]